MVVFLGVFTVLTVVGVVIALARPITVDVGSTSTDCGSAWSPSPQEFTSVGLDDAAATELRSACDDGRREARAQALVTGSVGAVCVAGGAFLAVRAWRSRRSDEPE